VIPARRPYISTGYRMHSLKLFANSAVFAATEREYRENTTVLGVGSSGLVLTDPGDTAYNNQRLPGFP
jgi:hypothetical protein